MSQLNLDAIRKRRRSREFYHSCPGWVADDFDALLERVDVLQKQSDGLVGLVRELLPLAGPCTCPHLKDCPHKRAQAVLAYLDSIEESHDKP